MRVVCFQSEKDVASWLRSGVVGQPSYDATTKEIIAQKKQTSDVTSQVNVKENNKNIFLWKVISLSFQHRFISNLLRSR